MSIGESGSACGCRNNGTACPMRFAFHHHHHGADLSGAARRGVGRVTKTAAGRAPAADGLFLFGQRVRQGFDRQLAGGIVAHPQLAVGVQIVVHHHLYPQRAVGQLARRQYGAGAAPVFTQLQLQIFRRLRGRGPPYLPASRAHACWRRGIWRAPPSPDRYSSPC